MILGDLLALAFKVIQGAARHQHRAAGHADCAARAAHNVGVSERRAAGDQAVHHRRDELGVSEGANGVEALVIREEENDVGTVGYRA
jgi:hypothetical protein